MTRSQGYQTARSFVKGKELPLTAAALFLLLCFAYSFSIDIRATRGASITGDEPFYLLTTQSLLADGDFDLRNQYEVRSYESFFDHPGGLWRQSVPKPEDGRLLSPHNPGLSFLVIPGFGLGGLAGAQIQLMAMGAATMALAYALADRLTGRRLLSWAVTLGVGLTATAFVYSTEIYPEFPAALALVLALLVVTQDKRLGLADGLLLAALLSIMCWLGVKYAVLAALVAAYFLLKARWDGRLALLATGAASAGFFAWFHLHLFGGLTPYGVNAVYAGWDSAEILGGHIEWGERYYRLWGLFIDRRFGIGRWAPLLLVAVPGMVLLAMASPDGRHKLLLDADTGADACRHLRSHHHDGVVVPRPHLVDGAAALRCAGRAGACPAVLVGQNFRGDAGSFDPGDYGGTGPSRKSAGNHHRRRPVRHGVSRFSGP